MSKILKTLTLIITGLKVISGGAVAAQQTDQARMEITTNTRNIIQEQDIYAAIEYIQESGDFKVITARYHNLIFDLYWQEKALFAMVPVAQAGIQYALTKAREFDSEDSVLAGKMRSFVKMWSFNLASFTWPGWQEEGIAITDADRKDGLDAAQLNVRICKALGEGPVKLLLRVREPIEKAVRAEIKVRDEIVTSKRLRYIRPSEIVTLELEPAVASRICGAEALHVHIAH